MFGKVIEQAVLEIALTLIVCLLFPIQGGWLVCFIIGAILTGLGITALGRTGVFGGIVFALGTVFKVLPIIVSQAAGGWFSFIGEGKSEELRYIPIVALGLVTAEIAFSFYGNGFLGVGGAVALNVAGLGGAFLVEFILYSIFHAAVLIINLVLLVLVLISAFIVMKWGGNPFDQED